MVSPSRHASGCLNPNEEEVRPSKKIAFDELGDPKQKTTMEECCTDSLPVELTGQPLPGSKRSRLLDPSCNTTQGSSPESSSSVGHRPAPRGTSPRPIRGCFSSRSSLLLLLLRCAALRANTFYLLIPLYSHCSKVLHAGLFNNACSIDCWFWLMSAT